ncbi:peptidylprolyl isomerase [Nocardioides humilatus]|uniref:Peptidyl-prolyl cis-trans isomerase n=1 Tax=Nocardioides humilatus TaxID=2607660 RepID=A0A5B1L874_9ACTN|nr:peptidylprolyl isomerase [Nocardioides humilatus]KAA1415929.1 peptidylprolyl isomerase [Nocardioides humilatus]
MRAQSFLRPALVAASLTLALGLSACSDDPKEAEAKDKTTSSTSPTESTDATADTTVTETATGETCDYPSDGSSGDVDAPPTASTVSGKVPITMNTSIGDLKLELDADRTPCTVNSFVSLAEQGYFDGTHCHRLTTSGIYVLQCGDPTGTGAGGPGYSFADELDGTETYGTGTLAMANAGPNTNGSQFFIVYGDSPLPPAYTVFGHVDQATIDLVTQVGDAGTDESNGPGDGAPNTPVDIASVSVG